MAWKEEESTTVKIGTPGVLKSYSFDKATNETSKNERWEQNIKHFEIAHL